MPLTPGFRWNARPPRSDGAASDRDLNYLGKRVEEALGRSAFLLPSTTAADGDTTPTVAGVNVLVLSNTGATSVTQFDNGQENQLLVVRATNGNSTLVHGASAIVTRGGANIVLGTDQARTFLRITGGKWIEVG